LAICSDGYSRMLTSKTNAALA